MKIYFSSFEFIKDGVQVGFDISVWRAGDVEAAKELFTKAAHKFKAENRIDCDQIVLQFKEKDKYKLQRLVNGSISIKESFAHTIRTEVRSAINEKLADCVSDKFIN